MEVFLKISLLFFCLGIIGHIIDFLFKKAKRKKEIADNIEIIRSAFQRIDKVISTIGLLSMSFIALFGMGFPILIPKIFEETGITNNEQNYKLMVIMFLLFGLVGTQVNRLLLNFRESLGEDAGIKKFFNFLLNKN